MKKETVILYVIIALVVGFVGGATVGILWMTKGTEKTAMVQKPPMTPPGTPAPAAAPPPRDSIEAASQIQTLKEIVKKDPKNLPAWVELGNLYFDTDQPKEAIEAYSQYLAIKPNNADVRTDMGIMYRKLGQFDQGHPRIQKGSPKRSEACQQPI